MPNNNILLNQGSGDVGVVINLDQLLAYYPLSSGAVAYSGPVLTKTGNSSFTANAGPKGNTGLLSLVGDGGYANYNTGILAGTGDVSVGLWCKFASAGSGYLVSQRNPEGVEGEFVFGLDAGKVYYWDFTAAQGQGAIKTHSKSVADNQLHFVGFSRKASGQLSVYVDGIKESVAYTVRNLRSNIGIALGFDQRDSASKVTGGITDVFFFARALTDDEWLGQFQSQSRLIA